MEDSLAREKEIPLIEVLRKIEDLPPALNVLDFLKPEDQVKVIAEVKRASPSRGDLAAIPEPETLAKQYELGGASVISVLTEQRKFKGSLADLRAVRESVQIPVLRKDFTSSRYQIAEARLHGADMILLIVAALDRVILKDLYEFTLELGMTPLVETHSAAEIEQAVELDAKLIGVNARDLKTFELDRELFARVQNLIPQDSVKIAESAVLSIEDVQNYRDAGADAVLVGEALATAGDPRATVEQFTSVR